MEHKKSNPLASSMRKMEKGGSREQGKMKNEQRKKREKKRGESERTRKQGGKSNHLGAGNKDPPNRASYVLNLHIADVATSLPIFLMSLT